MIEKIAKHDLSHRKAIFLLELAQALEAIAVFLVVKKNSDPGVRRKLVESVLFEASKVAARLPQIGKRGKAMLNVPLHK